MNDKINELELELKRLKSKIKKDNTAKELNVPEKDIYRWHAPSRTFSYWSSKVVITVILWVSLLILGLFFLKEYPLIFTIIVITIVSIFLYRIKPSIIEHRITNKGIYAFNRFLAWDDIDTFYLAHKGDTTIVYLDLNLIYPQRLYLVIPDKDIKNVVTNLKDFVVYLTLKKKQSYFSKLTDGEYIPLNELL